jgi:hypothetical protein
LWLKQKMDLPDYRQTLRRQPAPQAIVDFIPVQLFPELPDGGASVDNQ